MLLKFFYFYIFSETLAFLSGKPLTLRDSKKDDIVTGSTCILDSVPELLLRQETWLDKG